MEDGRRSPLKRLLYLVLSLMVAAGCVYVFIHPEVAGFGPGRAARAALEAAEESSASLTHAARITWKAIDRPGDGFQVEMPEDPRPLQVPAYNEAGVSEPVNMIFSSPDGGTTYAVAWADNPPPMRMANHAPDPTLDAAREGLLARTQTSLVNETRCRPQGYPGRDILARNVGGGVLDARLIMAGQRLYMLTAAYPSMSARRDSDVKHFFNSFEVSDGGGVPSSVPAGAAPGSSK